ncbi:MULTISPECIES: AEC family transporter [Anaerotruncus]|jgi:predicted permease|uniref:AEC family transporter n=1 Tax=Anaerotruncus TaxID=244127 RepID=UPI00083786CF|nr:MULTISPECIES: AEC family transporter [Anaerotruncus]RGX55525.1 AEC family transporter [Anaerotruncus sp. AF02-27]
MQIDMQILTARLYGFLILIAFGFFAKKCGLLTDELHDRLNTIIMRLILPALLIDTMTRSAGPENIRLFLPMTAGGFCTFLLLLGAGWISAVLMRFKGDLRKAQMALMSFGSLGFFGIPLVKAVWGPAGAAAFGIYSIVDNIACWTIGLALSRGQTDDNGPLTMRDRLGKILQPASVGVFIGLLFMLLRVPTDNLVMEALGQIGSCSSPLAMICIGASIARIDLRKLYRGWPSVAVVVIKMILAPLLVHHVAGWLGIYEPARIFLTLITALPSSSMFALMCRDYGNTQVDYASQAAIITVFCSAFTLPLVAGLLQ